MLLVHKRKAWKHPQSGYGSRLGGSRDGGKSNANAQGDGLETVQEVDLEGVLGDSGERRKGNGEEGQEDGEGGDSSHGGQDDGKGGQDGSGEGRGNGERVSSGGNKRSGSKGQGNKTNK